MGWGETSRCAKGLIGVPQQTAVPTPARIDRKLENGKAGKVKTRTPRDDAANSLRASGCGTQAGIRAKKRGLLALERTNPPQTARRMRPPQVRLSSGE